MADLRDTSGCRAQLGWLIGIVLVTWMLPLHPATARQSPAAIVIDANTGATLHATAADSPRYPASLTKMMTVYIVFEELKRGRLKVSTPIRFSERAAAQQPSKVGLKPGQTIVVVNAIKALITKSANDVAVAVAEHISGSEIAFARRMTATARRLGMTRTVFQNASGLPDRKQVTTARDMARLGLALQDDFPKRYRMFSQRRFAFRGRTYKNHNRLLGRFQGTDGIKTGYTRASGFNITTSVRRGAKHVVGVVIGRKTGRMRNAAMRKLLTKALAKASVRRTRGQRRTPQLVAQPRLTKRPRPVARPSVARSPVARPQRVAAREFVPRPFIARHSRAATPRPTSRANVQRAHVRPPSTFGAQLARMNAGAAGQNVGRRVEVTGSVQSRATRPRTTHHVQIGAFFSEADAHDALRRAQQRAGRILQGYQPVSLRVTSSKRPLFRARFAGFDSQAASTTCARLKRVRVDCFVTRSN
ncbi:MAG: D-alanyl-D-alanine carboxypeptidase [Hyphomicrobiaceae bacterium]